MDLQLSVAPAGVGLRVVDYYAGAKHIVVRFDDGSSLDTAAIAAATGADAPTFNALTGTTQGDALAGTAQDDSICGLAGDDLIDAGDGADRISGDDGNDALAGGAGADDLAGGRGDDVLDGGPGNDVLRGGGDGFGAAALAGLDNTSWAATQAGSDTYRFGRGYGRDTVINGASDVDHDTVRLVGLAPQDVTFAREGQGNLQIEIDGTADVLIVRDYFAASGSAVEWIEFDGGVRWSVAEVNAVAVVGTAGADVFVGTDAPDVFDGRGGDDVIEGGAGADVLSGGSGNDLLYQGRRSSTTSDGAADVLDGGGGNDRLEGSAEDVVIGGPGDDTVRGGLAVYDLGDGSDRVAADTLRFGAGILPDQVSVARVDASGNTQLKLLAANSVLAIGGGSYDHVQPRRVEFADGTVWDWSNRAAVFPRIVGTSGADVITGTPLAEVILGGSGNDQLSGGGAGDCLDGGDGNNTLRGDAGDDVLVGLVGADLLYGGMGDDRYSIERSAAVFESPGEGTDTVEIRSSTPALITYTLGANLENLTLMQAGRGTGNELDNALTGSTGDDVLAGLAGNDVYRGGGGADSLFDAAISNDVYRVGEFDGADAIVDGGGDDVLELIDDPANTDAPDPARVRLVDTGDGLLVSIARRDGYAPNGVVLVAGMYQDFGVLAAERAIERISFADGTVWNLAAIQQRAADTSGRIVGGALDDVLQGTAGAEVLVGKGGADRIEGGAGDDVLVGGAGNDLLDGGPGADQMAGGAGDDTYYVDGFDDMIVEAGNGGIDTIVGSGRMGPNIERLVVGPAGGAGAYGNNLDNEMIGGPGNDVLDGGAGNDTLTGGGGADRLSGGAGDDTYYTDGFDTVYEVANEGVDTVYASAYASLWSWSNVENLTLTGTGSFNGTGNALANVLIGNAGNNELSGDAGNDFLDGGPGADRLIGGSGNDSYVVDDAADLVIEMSGQGTDSVAASVSYVLDVNVENLTLTGSAAINGTGNGLANTLQGNAGDNLLDGGAGGDTLRGGAGEDTYIVDSTSDVVTESPGGGTDRVLASVTRTLGSDQEHLTLTGSAAINGTGNAGANHLAGNGNNNTLNGAGGNDVLQGSAGNDTLADTIGRGVHDGGDGADILAGGTDRQFFAGGAGSDTCTLGGGADIVAFNRGDGADVVNAPTSGAGLGETNDTISLGGVRFSELRLARETNDLVLKVAGTADSIRLKNWYSTAGNRTVTALQMVVDSTVDYDAASANRLLNKRVVRLGFTTIVNAFNAAGAPADWAIPNATLDAAYLAGSDQQALGGSLAYRYARDGDLVGLDFASVAAVLADANFATAAQPFGAATAGGVRLAGMLTTSTQEGGAIRSDSEGTARPDAEVEDADVRWMLDGRATGAALGTAASRVLQPAASGSIDLAHARPVEFVVVADDAPDCADLAGAMGAAIDRSAVAARWALLDDAMGLLPPHHTTPALGGEWFERGQAQPLPGVLLSAGDEGWRARSPVHAAASAIA
jgi:Ca2+-binding RTX toxin-like protein